MYILHCELNFRPDFHFLSDGIGLLGENRKGVESAPPIAYGLETKALDESSSELIFAAWGSWPPIEIVLAPPLKLSRLEILPV